MNTEEIKNNFATRWSFYFSLLGIEIVAGVLVGMVLPDWLKLVVAGILLILARIGHRYL